MARRHAPECKYLSRSYREAITAASSGEAPEGAAKPNSILVSGLG